MCIRVCVGRELDTKPRQHGSAERWPSWAEPACRVMSPPDVSVPSALTPLPDPISGSRYSSLSDAFSLSHLPVFHLSTSPSYLSLALVVSSPCMQSPPTPRVYTNILFLSATHIFIFDIPKKQMVLPSSLFSSHSLRSPPPFSCPVFLSIQPV